MKPTEINEFLEHDVIGQEEALRFVAVAIFKHLQGERFGNLMLIGNSGTGKTTIMRSMEKLYAASVFGRSFYSEGEYFHPHSSGAPALGSYKNWRKNGCPMWYPTHSTAYYVGVTDKSFTSVSCTGFDAGFPAHRPGAGAGLKRPDQGRSLFQQEVNAFFLLAVDVFNGNKNNNRQQYGHSPD